MRTISTKRHSSPSSKKEQLLQNTKNKNTTNKRNLNRREDFLAQTHRAERVAARLEKHNL